MQEIQRKCIWCGKEAEDSPRDICWLCIREEAIEMTNKFKKTHSINKKMKIKKYQFVVEGKEIRCDQDSAQWLASQIGSAMGRMKSKKKAASSKKNGKLGGRPKKINNKPNAQ